MSHPDAAEVFLRDAERTSWHDESLWFVRAKRDRAVNRVPEWESLRTAASQIKAHTLSRLDEYLAQFEERATENGICVHWAADAEEHNRIVADILKRHGAVRVVKSKSMLTEECHLNAHLAALGIDVVDTDLGERIVQLAKESPSHIVLPAIHVKREEVGVLFHDHLGTAEGATDPTYLTEAARRDMRNRFLTADAAITGVNFAVAETGGFVVCTNEGNADLGVHLAPVHIACMGIEKIIPRAEHLGVFIRMLARSATGQPVTTYTSHFHRSRAGTELHVVIVDNGRSQHLGQREFRAGLKCIRCGACMNTCPVYRRSGGHSYGSTVPGPIGSVLAPGRDMQRYASLPFASTLCGSCTDVCPVKIDLHDQLYAWRQHIMQSGRTDRSKRRLMGLAARVFDRPLVYRLAGGMVRRVLRILPRRILSTQGWRKGRELPEPPAESFREWYISNRRNP